MIFITQWILGTSPIWSYWIGEIKEAFLFPALAFLIVIVNKRSKFHGLCEKQRKGRKITLLDERNWYNSVWQHLAEDLWKSGLLSSNNHNCILFNDHFPGYCLCFLVFDLKDRCICHYRQILIQVWLHSRL